MRESTLNVIIKHVQRKLMDNRQVGYDAFISEHKHNQRTIQFTSGGNHIDWDWTMSPAVQFNPAIKLPRVNFISILNNWNEAIKLITCPLLLHWLGCLLVLFCFVGRSLFQNSAGTAPILFN